MYYSISSVCTYVLPFFPFNRKNSVTLKFSMQIKVGQGDNAMTTMVESEASKHFVVITNEIQWQGSAGTLLKRDAFDGQVWLFNTLFFLLLSSPFPSFPFLSFPSLPLPLPLPFPSPSPSLPSRSLFLSFYFFFSALSSLVPVGE